MGDMKSFRVDRNKMVDAFVELKKILKENDLEEEIATIAFYTMAIDINDAEAAYPTIIKDQINADQIAFIVLKKCPLEDARMITFGSRRQKMTDLCKSLKELKEKGQDTIDPKTIERLLMNFE